MSKEVVLECRGANDQSRTHRNLKLRTTPFMPNQVEHIRYAILIERAGIWLTMREHERGIQEEGGRTHPERRATCACCVGVIDLL